MCLGSTAQFVCSATDVKSIFYNVDYMPFSAVASRGISYPLGRIRCTAQSVMDSESTVHGRLVNTIVMVLTISLRLANHGTIVIKSLTGLE